MQLMRSPSPVEATSTLLFPRSRQRRQTAEGASASSDHWRTRIYPEVSGRPVGSYISRNPLGRGFPSRH